MTRPLCQIDRKQKNRIHSHETIKHCFCTGQWYCSVNVFQVYWVQLISCYDSTCHKVSIGSSRLDTVEHDVVCCQACHMWRYDMICNSTVSVDRWLVDCDWQWWLLYSVIGECETWYHIYTVQTVRSQWKKVPYMMPWDMTWYDSCCPLKLFPKNGDARANFMPFYFHTAHEWMIGTVTPMTFNWFNNDTFMTA